MKGATALPPRITSPPTRKSATRIGVSHHFLLWRRKSRSSTKEPERSRFGLPHEGSASSRSVRQLLGHGLLSSELPEVPVRIPPRIVLLPSSSTTAGRSGGAWDRCRHPHDQRRLGRSPHRTPPPEARARPPNRSDRSPGTSPRTPARMPGHERSGENQPEAAGSRSRRRPGDPKRHRASAPATAEENEKEQPEDVEVAAARVAVDVEAKAIATPSIQRELGQVLVPIRSRAPAGPPSSGQKSSSTSTSMFVAMKQR